MFGNKLSSRSHYSLPLILLGVMTMIISLLLLFNAAPVVGVLPPIIGFGIGGVVLIVGLAFNSKLNNMKTNEEKFVSKLEKIDQLPIVERQKEIKKISLRLSGSLFLNMGFMILMLKISTNNFDSEFFLNDYFGYTLLAAAALFAISGFYVLKFKKWGVILAVAASLFQATSMILYFISVEESHIVVFFLNFGTAWVVNNLIEAYKYLK